MEGNADSMTKFRIEAPDGKVFDVEGPEGATAEQALAQVQQSYKPEVQPASALERSKATLGGVNRGIAGLLGLPVDTAENIANLGIAGVGSLAAAAGRPDLSPQPLKGSFGGSDSIARLMERFNIGTTNPRPDDAASRMLNTGGMIAGGSMIPGAGVKSTLTAAGGGALAGEVLGPEYVGVGAMAPAAAGQAAVSAKNAIAAKTAPVVETFKQAGTVPSVGQALDNVFLHGLENLASKFPGGAGVMQKFIEGQQRSMGAQARTGVPAEAAGRAIEKGVTGEGGFLARTKAQWNQLDDAVAAKIPKDDAFVPANTVQALDELTRKVKGAEQTTGALINPKISDMAKNLIADSQQKANEIKVFRGTSGTAHDFNDPNRLGGIFFTRDRAYAEEMAKRSARRYGGTPKVDEFYITINKPHPGGLAPQAVKESGFDSIVPKQMSKDEIVVFDKNQIRQTGIPFEALRALRSKVGSMLDESLVTGIPGGELKKVYGALSKDLEAAATQAGAGREFARQNNFYRARMDRIETVLDRVIGKGKQPEDIFKAFMPSDPDQANKARAVMRSLSPSERQVVSEAVANRLGRAKPGAQDISNEIFSSETFLTNWNKLSPGAKAQIFPEPPLRENMEHLARASSEIRSGKGIYANPSGTAGSFAAYSIYLAPLTALGYSVSGTPGAAGVLASAAVTAGGANIGAKMMTSPRIVEWLATPVNPKSPQAAAHLARLGVIYNNTKDPALKEELATFIQGANQ